jgi:hypothetical protein
VWITFIAAVAPEEELAVKTPGSNKNTPNLKARKSGK